MSKLELVKKLECLIAFQSICLNEGNWKDYDLAENKVKELEKKIVEFKNK
jgi:hypothetical protein